MSKDDILDFIEDKKMQNYDGVYYHAFPYRKDKFIKMVNRGIMSPILLGKESKGNNGYFYVSLSKKEECEYSVYELLKHLPMFVIDGDMRTIKVKNYRRSKYGYGWAVDLPLPFRESSYDDEYQKFLCVSPRHFLAIQYNLYLNRMKFGDIDNDLVNLKSIVESLENEEVDLPIIDGSSLRVINKDKVKRLNL